VKLVCLGLLAALLSAQPAVFPLEEVQPGLEGTGKTVFSGAKVEEFHVRILGVLKNAGPKQSIILARLSGGPLEKTGILQGMSGSPVYIDGRLLGAVALAFPFTREPIAGIRPIEEMLRVSPSGGAGSAAARVSLWDRQLTHLFPRRQEFVSAGSRLVEIATPVSFGGFTAGTIDQFAPELTRIGLEPRGGIAGGGGSAGETVASSSIEPGSMISVLLLSGDMSIGADGTVTCIDGNRIYAFGHRFLSVGRTSLPFTRSEVLALAPNLSTSFKISASRETLGAVTADYSTAVSGELGLRAAMAPLTIHVRGPEGRSQYRMEMVNDSYLSPFLLQMALYSAIDATERTLGSSSISVRGRIEFENGIQPVRLDDMYAGAGNIPLQASLGTAIPMAYALQSGFSALKMKAVSVDVDVYNEKRYWQIDQVWPGKATVRPGESVELTVVLTGENGAEQTHRVTYKVPIGAPDGALHFTVADAATTNLTEYLYLAGEPKQSPEQVVSLLNGLRTNTGVYVRVWRAERGYRVRGRSLPAPPASVSLILGGKRSPAGGASVSYSSKLAELAIDLGTAVVTGSKTIQVEVKQ